MRSQESHGGWRMEEERLLFAQIEAGRKENQPLKAIFAQVAAATGRKPNSVRNFYYACLKREDSDQAPHAAPFQTFTAEEVRALMREVLAARANGISVRACVQRMADGDRKLMLRYQNKYRSVLKSRPSMVREIMAEMTEAGEKTFDPYAAQMTQAQPLHAGIAATIQKSGDPALLGLLRGLDTLLMRAGMMEPAPLKAACEPMVQCAKEFLGLPDERRAQALPSFCAQMSQCVGAVETAMGV